MQNEERKPRSASFLILLPLLHVRKVFTAEPDKQTTCDLQMLLMCGVSERGRGGERVRLGTGYNVLGAVKWAWLGSGTGEDWLLLLLLLGATLSCVRTNTMNLLACKTLLLRPKLPEGCQS